MTNLNQVNLKGKKVILRVAYDITLARQGSEWVVPDNARIKETLFTLEYLLKNHCKIIIISYLKRPGGKVVARYRLDPVAKELSRLIKKPIRKLDDCVGPAVEKAVGKMKSDEIVMLENTRFHPEEEKADPKFAKQLAKLADLCVFDAFPQAHRVHASTTGLVQNLPTVFGFAIEKELTTLSKLLDNPARPFIVILGGAKIFDKLDMMKNLTAIADKILVVGALANTFLKSQNVDVGQSLFEGTSVNSAQGKTNYFMETERLLQTKKIILPSDLISASNPESKKSEIVELATCKIKSDHMFLDIGPKTIKDYQKVLISAKTVFFNGTAGVSEQKLFRRGTCQLAKAIANLKTTKIISGGDTTRAVKECGYLNKMSYVSTAGGATLEFLAGKKLPVLEALGFYKD